MPVTLSALNPIGGMSRRGTGVALWSYKTSDGASTIDTEGYFNEASGMLSVGDLILVVTTSSGTPIEIGFHVVMSNTAGVVDVSNVVDLTATVINDSD